MSEDIKGNGGDAMTDEEYKNFDYSKFVDCLRAPSKPENLLFDALHSAVGISGEAGELLDHFKKAVWQQHEVNREYVLYELGDILFYLTSMCNLIGTDIDEVRKLNIEKLTKRYPDGVFDAERSINRNEEIQNGSDKGCDRRQTKLC